MQVLGARQIDQEGQHGQDMNPPEHTIETDLDLGSDAAKYWSNESPNRCPGFSIGSRKIDALNQHKCEQNKKDQAQNNIAIPWTVQRARELLRTKNGAADSEENKGEQNEHYKGIKHAGEDRITTQQRQRAIDSS